MGSLRHEGPAALLLDTEQKSALAAIRSLGARGINVIAGSCRQTAMGLYSRYVQRRFYYPSPLEDQDGFVDCIIREAAKTGHPVLYSFSDSTLLPLTRVVGADQNWCWPLGPTNGSFRIAFDKALTLKLAESIGIGTPLTYSEGECGLGQFLKNLSFPVVVKPRRSVSWHCVSGHRGGLRLGVKFATSRQELDSQWTHMVSQTDEFPLVQEYIRGEQASVQFLCDHGSIVAACANRRLRSSHPTGGPGALKQTVPLSYFGLAENAQRLVSALNWSGPIMVEFKIDELTHSPKLMEINGRFWGSLPLAVLAGIDFPYLYYRIALHLKVSPSCVYPEQVTSRHLMSDLRHLYSALFRRDPMRPFSYPKRWAALGDFLAPPPNCKSDVVNISDPAPALAEIFDIVWTRLRLL